MRPFFLILLVCALVAPGESRAQSAVAAPTTQHANRRAVLARLRAEGFLQGGTSVVSAVWQAERNQWLVTLRHPGGELSWWMVDAAARNYQGGICGH